MQFFNIATNLTNGPFMIGYENETDNFYLKGEIIGDIPYISCRLFNSRGELLFIMARNNLSPDYEGRYHIQSDLNNFIVTDNEGNVLLKVYTRDEKDNRVTYIEGYFFDKKGKLAARGDERGLLINCPLRM